MSGPRWGLLRSRVIADEILARVVACKLFAVDIAKPHVETLVKLLEIDGSLIKCNSMVLWRASALSRCSA